MSERYEISGHNVVVDDPLVECAFCGYTVRDSFECEKCGKYFCEFCHRAFHGDICDDCYMKEQEKIEDRINHVSGGIQIEGFWYAGRADDDDKVILEYISDDYPIEVHIPKGE